MSKIKIVSWNIRCKWDGDDKNSLLHRAGMILEKIDQMKPDVICFQETTTKSASFLKKYLTDYTVIFNCREEDFTGEGLATAYRKDTAELHTVDRFWLSPTPNIPGSRFENQSINPRICQVCLFQDIESGKLYRTYNNHLDHISDEARIIGINRVLERVSADKEVFDCPFFILGDFNDFPDSKVIEYCNNYEETPIFDLTENLGCTYHGFGELPDGKQIDYIYTDKASAEKPYTAEKWTDEINGIFLSDHYPVCVEIEL